MSRQQTVQCADTATQAAPAWRLELEYQRARALESGWEFEPELGLGPELALEFAPTTPHTARQRRPKLPGISSRFLLETNSDAQPLKSRLISACLPHR